MKLYIYILVVSAFGFSFAFSAQTNSPDALSWYGYNSFSTNSQYSSDYDFGNKDDEISRKRRHRRRRKISPEKKGW